MHTSSLIKKLLKINNIVVENIHFETANEEDEDDILIISVRPFAREQRRCPICFKLCQGYDSFDRTRRWRSLDFGSMKVYLESRIPRVKCCEHGIKVAKVPWARHDSDYTYDFETAVTWFALHACASDVAEYFRINWHTVGSISKRVQESLEQSQPSRFDNLEAIGIDETSYKKGHKYMTVVVDHNTGHLIWAKKGYGKTILTQFFEELTEEQRAKIKLVSADGAGWIKDCIAEFCPNAERCIDPFHVVAWANDSLDEIRKETIRRAKIDAANGEKAVSGKKRTPKQTNTLC